MSDIQPDTTVFHALADRNRLAMLDLLFEKERAVQDIADHFDITLQGVSQHLNVLAKAGLVSKRKDGRFRYYRADASTLQGVYDWVSQYRQFWSQGLDRLDRYLDDAEEK